MPLHRELSAFPHRPPGPSWAVGIVLLLPIVPLVHRGLSASFSRSPSSPWSIVGCRHRSPAPASSCSIVHQLSCSIVLFGASLSLGGLPQWSRGRAPPAPLRESPVVLVGRKLMRRKLMRTPRVRGARLLLPDRRARRARRVSSCANGSSDLYGGRYALQVKARHDGLGPLPEAPEEEGLPRRCCVGCIEGAYNGGETGSTGALLSPVMSVLPHSTPHSSFRELPSFTNSPAPSCCLGQRGTPAMEQEETRIPRHRPRRASTRRTRTVCDSSPDEET